MGSRDDWRQLVVAVNSYGLRPVVDEVLSLDRRQATYERLDRAQQFGKIVLSIDG